MKDPRIKELITQITILQNKLAQQSIKIDAIQQVIKHLVKQSRQTSNISPIPLNVLEQIDD